MAISPTVNAYMIQNQMANSMPSEQLFRNKFSDAAFSTLRAKFPKLANLVISLKIIELDVDTGFCLAAFIIKSKADVKYIPVVMANGSVVSCEMVYDKAADQIMPLLPKIVDQLVNNNIETATLLDKPPVITDTKRLFSTLLRPPTSSNAILASDSGDAVRNLPNSAKKQVTSYLESNPELLAKIAEFYPVEVLAEKLATSVEEQLPKTDFPDVVSIEDLKDDTKLLLSEADKEALLRDGFTVRKELPEDGVEIFTEDGIKSQVERNLNLTELKGIMVAKVQVGTAYRAGAAGYEAKKALIFSAGHGLDVCSSELFSVDSGVRSEHDKEDKCIVVSNHREATQNDLLANGFVPVNKFKIPGSKDGVKIVIAYPRKSSGYTAITKYIYSDATIDKTDDRCVITIGNSRFIFDNELKFGCIDQGEQAKVFPMGCFVKVCKNNYSSPFASSVEDFVKYLKVHGTKVSIISDGIGFSVNTKHTAKNFPKKAHVARHLVETYGLGRMEVDAALKSTHSYIFSKKAFLTPSAQQDFTSVSQQQVAPMMQNHQPGFNPEVMNNFAEMGDQEMLDTGILASFNQDVEIKDNFIEMLPSFLDTLTNVGKTILICSVQKEEMEKYYGREKYTSFLANARRVFKTLGEIVVDMRSYNNMIQ